jgi:hypothetical protein
MKTVSISRKVVVAAGAVSLLTIATIVFFETRTPEVQTSDSGMSIGGLANAASNLPSTEQANMESALYYTIALNVPGGEVPRVADAVIRSGSYRQTREGDTYHTEFIVDIASLRQSYRVANRYFADGMSDDSLYTYDYATTVTCPDPSELVFGDFGCVDVFIMQSMPAGGEETAP